MATLNNTRENCASGPNPFFSIGSSKSCKIERKRERERDRDRESYRDRRRERESEK